MKSLIFLCAVCLNIDWIYARGGSSGVGAFSYQDSAGNRYGGTYGLEDGKVVDAKGEFPPDFAPPDFAPRDDFSAPDFGETFGFFPESGFFPEYFRNLENLLQDPWFEHYPPPPYIPHIPLPSFNRQPSAFTPFPFGGMFKPFDFQQFQLNMNSPWFEHYPPPPYIPHIPLPSFNRQPSAFTPFPFGGMFKPFDFQQFQLNMNRAFQANLENQRLAMNAAHKAFDLTTNRAGFVPNLNPSRLTPFRDIDLPAMPIPPQFPKAFPFSGPLPGFDKSASSSSFAAAAAGPGINHHVAVISPGNPLSPNVNEMNAGSGKLGGFKEVSVSSFVSSSDVGGKKQTKQEVNTYINDNGKVTAHTVHNP